MAGELAERLPPARIVEIPDPSDPAEIEAIRSFTTPCTWCVPGARSSWETCPVVFEHPDERDPGTDWTDLYVVVRNEPSRSPDGSTNVVGRSSDGRDVIIAREQHPVPPGTLIWLGEDD
jgi:hypothetical protein